jgi:hypothetical protein
MAKRVAMVMAIAALLVALVAGVAVAKTFVCDSVPCAGTEKSDQIGERKGQVHDDIRAKGGDDTINVRRYGNDFDEVNAGSGNDTIYADDGDTRDVIQCGDGTDTAYIDVVYDGTTVKSSDKVYNCEKVYDQTGKEVPSLENLDEPTTTTTTTSTTDSADTTSSPSTTTSSDKSTDKSSSKKK